MHGHCDTHLKQYPLSDIRRTKATILLYSKHGSQYNLTENFHQNLDGELDEGWLKATELVIPLSVHVNTVWILSLFTKLCQWELLERNEGKNHTSLKKSNLTMGTRLQMNVVLLFKKIYICWSFLFHRVTLTCSVFPPHLFETCLQFIHIPLHCLNGCPDNRKPQ